MKNGVFFLCMISYERIIAGRWTDPHKYLRFLIEKETGYEK